MARVYGIYNRTKRQRYYGITKRPIKRRIEEHAVGKTEATRHWNFKKDKIYYRTIVKKLRQSNATDKAHELEERKPPPRWKTIQTGGR